MFMFTSILIITLVFFSPHLFCLSVAAKDWRVGTRIDCSELFYQEFYEESSEESSEETETKESRFVKRLDAALSHELDILVLSPEASALMVEKPKTVAAMRPIGNARNQPPWLMVEVDDDFISREVTNPRNPAPHSLLEKT